MHSTWQSCIKLYTRSSRDQYGIYEREKFFSSLLCWKKSGVWRLKFLRVGRCRSFNIHSYTHKNVLHHSPTSVKTLFILWTVYISIDTYRNIAIKMSTDFFLSRLSLLSLLHISFVREFVNHVSKQTGVSSDLKIGAKNKTIRVNWTM